VTASTSTSTAILAGSGDVPEGFVTCTVDGVVVSVPKGTLIIRAAELLGVAVPRFCDHPLLDPVANCRMCLIEIDGMPKPQPSCATPVAEGMVVRTQLTSAMADAAQQGVMEFLLINHPLDCPICDKGGECPLQNQSMSNGRAQSRFSGVKRTFPKPINVSAQILLDRERCVSCARCTRFADEIAGEPFIALMDRGSKQQVGTADDQPFDSYFSGNTIQICPVGALTSARYRFRSRPFDLVSVPTVCEHCASGCGLRTDFRRSSIMRRLAWDEPEVNEEWNCDKGRFAFPYVGEGRLTHPLVRDEDGELRPASWPEALDVAARGLAAAHGRAAVLTGGRLTREDAYAYAKFARVVLATDDIDFRARPHSAEESAFLAARVAGTGRGVTYADLEKAPTVLLVGFEPEEESPIIFLRLRKAVRRGSLAVHTVAPYRTEGSARLSASVIHTTPGGEAAALDALTGGDIGAALRAPGSVILVGERLASIAGSLSAAARLAESTGASLAWVPRRAGERGALDSGAIAGLLPGGRPLIDAAARIEVATMWGVDVATLPSLVGRSTDDIIRAILDDQDRADAAHADNSDRPDVDSDPGAVEPVERAIAALVVAGVDPDDLTDPVPFRYALEAVPFIVSLETRHTKVTAQADVVLPVAAVAEKAGSFTDWEGRVRSFNAVLHEVGVQPDGRVLAMIADQMDVSFGRGDVVSLRNEISALGGWTGARSPAPGTTADQVSSLDPGHVVLATWRHLLDAGTLQEGEPYLASTARTPVIRLSATRAAALQANDGDEVTVTTHRGSITLPVEITDLPDDVVWLPTNSVGSRLRFALGVDAGDVVLIARGGDPA
jgi:NADH-quinone oxidoreductase subunit G